jgi:NAD-dependent DNA ligase-like protein
LSCQCRRVCRPWRPSGDAGFGLGHAQVDMCPAAALAVLDDEDDVNGHGADDASPGRHYGSAPVRPAPALAPGELLSERVVYRDGALVKAAARGDGHTGEDVMPNIRAISSIPARLSGTGHPAVLEVRGEVFMPVEAFGELNESLLDAGKAALAQPAGLGGDIPSRDRERFAGRHCRCVAGCSASRSEPGPCQRRTSHTG